MSDWYISFRHIIIIISCFLRGIHVIKFYLMIKITKFLIFPNLKNDRFYYFKQTTKGRWLAPENLPLCHDCHDMVWQIKQHKHYLTLKPIWHSLCTTFSSSITVTHTKKRFWLILRYSRSSAQVGIVTLHLTKVHII